MLQINRSNNYDKILNYNIEGEFKIMEIILGKTAGFCFGVKKAVEGAIQEKNRTKEPIFCLGDIVHNTQVIKKLEGLGIKCIKTIEEANGTVLIRAHGIPKEVYHVAKKMNVKIQDFTCPNVLKIHKVAEEFNNEGYFIFLLGNKNHPENIGTLSHCGKNYYIFEKEEELDKAIQAFEKSKRKKLLLISQTTFALEKFHKIVETLRQNVKNDINLVVKNTICKSTELRQKETQELSKKVDSMIVIGGRNSSNTNKLYEISKEHCKNTMLVENVAELEKLEIKANVKKIGIMAGASTPRESIEEIIMFLKRRF